MPKIDIWPVIHSERGALVADLTSLPAEKWDTPSLCSSWTVRDVLAHMTATAKISGGTFFPKLIGAGFSLARLQEKDLVTERGDSPDDTLARFKGIETSVRHPPGPGDTWLGETIIHAEDIRRALGMDHDYPMAALVQVADFYKGSNLVIGTKRRIAGLRMMATDTDWSYGTGPEVSGPMVAVLMAMTGRQPPLNRLSGDGVDTLRSRA
ncbi:MAG TPA: maleylpyruvate isomerase family mycothiol-dependent enzyme [Acidimicrobiales bacterium]|nr:maleylpyruvate isomerase family mycothiol-dependent enzyme [Acidimicrobiales bacterium]